MYKRIRMKSLNLSREQTTRRVFGGIYMEASQPGIRASSLCRDDFIQFIHETLEARGLAKTNHWAHRY